jgi:hypothetical protein
MAADVHRMKIVLNLSDALCYAKPKTISGQAMTTA